MKSRPFIIANHLIRTCQAPNLLNFARHRWMSPISSTSLQVKLSTTTSTLWRRPVTTRETREVERQIEYASANDTPVDKEAAENAIANAPKHEVDTPEEEEQEAAENTTANTLKHKADKSFRQEPEPLPEDHALALEEVKQRLTTWIDPILTSESYSKRSSQVRKLAEGVFVALARPQGSNYALKVTFDRIEKANALNAKLMTNLTIVFQALSTLPGLSVVRLASRRQDESEEQPARVIFSAGADVKEMSQIETPAQAEQFIRTVSALCTAARNLPALVIAQIDGPCIGAGLELAASCDLRYATKAALFSMPEVQLGIPSVVQARLLCDIVGWARARDLMLAGGTWSAQQALDAGLVSALFEDAIRMGEHTSLLMRKVAQLPQAYKSQKRLMHVWEDCSIDEGIEASVKAFSEVWENDQTKQQAKSAMKEVLEKKPTKKPLETAEGAPIRKMLMKQPIRKTFRD